MVRWAVAKEFNYAQRHSAYSITHLFCEMFSDGLRNSPRQQDRHSVTYLLVLGHPGAKKPVVVGKRLQPRSFPYR